MEMHLKQYEKECLKTTMLKHEETFKEQICELHRLYHVQKLLMNDMRKREMMHHATIGRPDSRDFSVHARLSSQGTRYQSQDPPMTKTMIDLEHPAEENSSEDSEDTALESEVEEETEIELTLSTGCKKNKKKKKQEEPIYWNVGGSFPSMSNQFGSSQIAIVGTHPRLNSRERLTGTRWESFRNEQKTYNDEELSRKERRTRWLFPVLSLNVT